MSDGWATGEALFEPSPPPEPIAPHARRRVTASPHVVRCKACGVELIYPGAAPVGAACTTCETKET